MQSSPSFHCSFSFFFWVPLFYPWMDSWANNGVNSFFFVFNNLAQVRVQILLESSKTRRESRVPNPNHPVSTNSSPPPICPFFSQKVSFRPFPPTNGPLLMMAPPVPMFYRSLWPMDWPFSCLPPHWAMSGRQSFRGIQHTDPSKLELFPVSSVTLKLNIFFSGWAKFGTIRYR